MSNEMKQTLDAILVELENLNGKVSELDNKCDSLAGLASEVGYIQATVDSIESAVSNLE